VNVCFGFHCGIPLPSWTPAHGAGFQPSPPCATRLRVPRSQALRAVHTVTDSCLTEAIGAASVSLSTASLHRVGLGNAYRGLSGCAGMPGEPATIPHSGIRDSLPSLAPIGAAPSARAALPRQCPARFSGPMSSAHSLSVLPILLPAFQRVACRLPNRLARTRRG
jgi:hypothetical protein